MKGKVSYLLEKLYLIDKKLGGDSLKKNIARKKGNEFDMMKELILEDLFKLDKKQNRRDELEEKYGHDQDTIGLNEEIRGILEHIKRDIDKLDKMVESQSKNKKKFSQKKIDQRRAIVKKLAKHHKECVTREKSGQKVNEEEHIKTLEELKRELMGPDGQQDNANEFNFGNDPDEADLEVMERWQRVDEDQDRQIGEIILITEEWKKKVRMQGNKIETTADQIYKMREIVDSTKKEVDTQNKQLKDILKKYRRPNQFCLDLTLVLLLAGLGIMIYNSFKSNIF